MAYIGNKLADAYTSFAKQDFTTSATTSYTLDYPVANANEIALFINFVRQEPTTAYTASGTSLTLTSATSASDDMYCVFLGKALRTVNPPAGSVGLSQLSATGTKDSTTFLRGDNTFASAGESNVPAFSVKLSSDQNVSDNAITKIQFNSENYDTDNAFDSTTNYRFTVPSGQDGKYFFNVELYSNCTTSDQINTVFLYIYKNGSAVSQTAENEPNTVSLLSVNLGTSLDLVAGDYIEFFGQINIGTGTPFFDGDGTWFLTQATGFKITE